MPPSKSRFAYDDCYALMEAALADGVGTRYLVDDVGKANQLRLRLNYARSIDREQNAETYELEHPMHGRSEYDKLIFKVNLREGQWWVYIEVNTINPLKIEGLSGVEDKEPEFEPPEMMIVPERAEPIKRRF